MSALDQLWPGLEQTRATLGTDAQSLAPHVLLAVHQPMKFRRVEWGKEASESPLRDEYEILNALLAPESDGWTIVPIEGESGVGKSHVVKWLEAQLHARDDAAQRHVILVPKNSSLKSIIRLILDRLDGPEFDEIRAALERASESIPEVAARQLRTQIVVALREEAKDANQRRRAGTRSQEDAEIEWGATVAALLDEPAFWAQRFLGDPDRDPGVVMQIVRNLSYEGAIEVRRFEAGDFQDLGELVPVKDLSKSVRKLVPMLQSATRREQVAGLYNRVLDRATQSLLDLGGTPLSEVFLRLREALLAREQELVILVEDFAVLSGMQEALLRALVQEGRVDGQRRYCTIRSALAYTRGTRVIGSLDTLQTRANVRWVIEDKLADEHEIIERAIELVGAYLNAARWGEAKLSTLRIPSIHGEAGPRVPKHQPEDVSPNEQETIEAFGSSHGGFPLFPFNREAIGSLVREKCAIAGRLVFNPRLIINRIVLEVIELRRHYERGLFPPPSLSTNTESLVIATDVIGAIDAQSQGHYKRVMTFVSYWGGNPDSLGIAARISPLLYCAFDIPVIDFGAATPKKQSRQSTPKQRGASSLPDKPVVATDPFDRKWKDLLDKWQRGIQLVQRRAGEIRKAMAAAMYASFPHDWAGSRPPWETSALEAKEALGSKHTYVPNARGGGGLSFADAAIVLCEDDVWADARRAVPYRKELEAVLRFHDVPETKGRWDYVGGEVQAAHYARFVTRRRPRYLAAAAAERAKRAKASTRTLVEVRLLSAAVLGHAVSGGNHLDAALDVLMRELPQQPVRSELSGDWRRLLEFAGRRAREAWAHLVDLVAVRQGYGKRLGTRILAIDIVEVDAAAREFMKTWTLTDKSNDLRRPLDKGLASRSSELARWCNSVTGWLGDSFDKDEFMAEISSLLTEAKASKHEQLVPDDEIKTLRNQLKRFRDARVAEALTKAQRGSTGEWGPVTLAALAYDDAEAMRITNELGGLLERMLGRVEGRLEATAGTGAKAREQMAREVERELELLQNALDSWGEATS
ncbi:hypothetical protein ENSA5_36020 [Enhygromyxa salina]|uniref:Uncharacterized protein n=1 Tax=Enhygromyxa salina TaxID=215803 RepID=A0A2S9XUI3_9BACT|nr:protein DpdH [Enhygromyxa salina]PRP96526.1 hypothetical protein ENSA5_36020 [Enhygromyxa salina]